VRVNTLSWLVCLALPACGPQPDTRQAVPVAAPTPGTPATSASAPAPATPGTPATSATPAPPQTGLTLGAVRDDVPLPLTALLGHSVAEVQAQLGEHTGKGMQRESCVRHVPERTFFGCHYALQRYLDKTGTWAGVRIGYEDNVATEVSYDGFKAGSGPVTPEALLAAAGLTLPAPGKESAPASDVRLWTWFNSLARLKIGGKQYRVEASVVGDDWARTRVSVILNDPLTPEQQAKIRPVIAKDPISEAP
jgi:hypothetical protein